MKGQLVLWESGVHNFAMTVPFMSNLRSVFAHMSLLPMFPFLCFSQRRPRVASGRSCLARGDQSSTSAIGAQKRPRKRWLHGVRKYCTRGYLARLCDGLDLLQCLFGMGPDSGCLRCTKTRPIREGQEYACSRICAR